ncbi:MAG: glycosyltransferase family 1 protein, partial [Nitrosopumilales archaeon]
MKIGLIAESFEAEKGTGIARYADELRKGLIERGISVKSLSVNDYSVPFQGVFNHSLLYPSRVLMEMKNVDIVHATSPGTAFVFPFLRKPKVVTFHDMVSILCGGSGAAFYTKKINPIIYKMIAAHSSKIIANSLQTKSELVENLKISSEKINVVNMGISNAFFPISRMELRECYFVGYLGSFLARKRIGYLIDSFNLLINAHPELRVKLMIYGGTEKSEFALSEQTKRLGLEGQVHIMGPAPDEQINDIYNSFDVFVLPSEWEGFGIPILEAQKCGVPVIIRGEAHIPGETSLHCVKSSSCSDMADKMYALLSDPVLRDRT